MEKAEPRQEFITSTMTRATAPAIAKPISGKMQLPSQYAHTHTHTSSSKRREFELASFWASGSIPGTPHSPKDGGWNLVGGEGLNPSSRSLHNPYICPYNSFLHSLLSTRENLAKLFRSPVNVRACWLGTALGRLVPTAGAPLAKRTKLPQ